MRMLPIPVAALATALVVVLPLPQAAADILVVRAESGVEPGDWAPLVNATLARAEPGDTVVLSSRREAYEIRSAITIDRDGITLEGTGATVRFADNAMGGKIIDCIEVVGTPEDPVEGVIVRGFTIDANYWNQPSSHNPRGFDSDHATGLLVKDVTITNAFVGLTFGMGVGDASAVGCRVTRYFDDAFNASGDGVSGGCRGIEFVDCVAEDAPNEVSPGTFDPITGGAGGPAGHRNNAWEIEDGAQDVRVIRCVVRNVDGNGFAVRNHGGEVATSGVVFEGCRAESVRGFGWHVFSGGYPNTVEDITLRDCTTDSVVRLHKDIRGLTLRSCDFGAAVTLGPCRGMVATGCSFTWLRIWAQTVNGGEPPAGYVSGYRFENCTVDRPLWILGDPSLVRFPGAPAR
ncbi:MAG: hypothetical protein AAFR38_03995 [Planctomycetota bacterium]